MALDMTLLRLSLNRARFDRLAPGVPDAGLERTTTVMMDDIAAFYKEFPDVRDIDIKTFKVWFFSFRHATMAADEQELFRAVLTSMAEPVPEGMENGMTERLLQTEFGVSVIGAVMKWNEGGEFDLHMEIAGMAERMDERLDRKTRVPLVTETPEELMQADEVDGGIHFRLNALKKSMRPMRGGDYIIIAARPDKGKTTFITSEASSWVAQLPAVYPDEYREGLWFINEGPGFRVKQRFYQSVLGATVPEMVEMVKAGTLTKNLTDKMGGDIGRMKFFNIHDFYSHEVEAIIKQHKPAFCIFDMVDHIKFTGGLTNGGTRTDQVLEEMYKTVRNWSVKYDFVGIATSQISGEGDGLQYPPMSALKDSKTGKQGACDAIIMVGSLNDPGMDRYRYIGVPKNKLHKPGGPRDPRTEVTFDAERARFVDPEE